MARDGIADVTYVSPGYQPGRFPIIDAGNLPFMMANAKGGSQALDEWYRKHAGTEMKDVKFCLGFVHDYGSFHSKTKKIMVPADIKGMKIRPAHATIATLVTTLGGTNVQASAPEVRDIIEKGVAEAVTFPWGSIPLFGIDKVTKYHMNTPLYVTSFAWVINKAKYEGMSEAQREGHRQPLQQRVGASRCGPLVRLRARRRRQAAGRHRQPRGLHHLGRPARRVEAGGGAGREGLGRQRAQGWRRPRCDPGGPEGDAQQVQLRLLRARPRRPGSTDAGAIAMTAASFLAAVAVPRA